MTTQQFEEICQAQITKNFEGAIVVLNSSFEIVYVSSSIFNITGFGEDQLLGQSITKLFPANVDILRANLTQGKIPSYIKFYQALRCSDNKTITTRIRLSQEYDKEGNLYFILYIKNNSFHKSQRYELLKKALTLEKLSRSTLLTECNLDASILEILTLSSKSMPTQRVSAWLFDKEHSLITCIGSFDSKKGSLVNQKDINRFEMPKYFSLFESEKIIVTIDAMTSPRTDEIREKYLIPHNIHSLMDIPFRREGEIIGVVCFEHVGEPREWNIQEQAFGLMIAQMIALALESYRRIEVCKEKDAMLAEKNVLLKEVKHRVKDNLSFIAGLVSTQESKAEKGYVRELFTNLHSKIISIAEIHSLLYQSENYTRVNFKTYLSEIIRKVDNTMSKENQLIRIRKNIDDSSIDITYALPIALITTELISNSYKYAFGKKKEGLIDIGFSLNNKTGLLKIKDNGKGFRLNSSRNSLGGLEIVKSLSKQLGAEMEFKDNNGASFQFRFPINAA